MKSFGLFPTDAAAIIARFCDTYANELADETYRSLVEIAKRIDRNDSIVLLAIADWFHNEITDDDLLTVIGEYSSSLPA